MNEATHRLRALLALAVVVVLASCSQHGDGRRSSSEPPTQSPSSPNVVKPSPRTSFGGTFTGTLGLAEVEGGCPYLEVEDGTRYQVRYPDGWELRRSPLQLVSPDGEVVARAGGKVTVRGLVVESMASTCQVGPTIQATEVVAP